MSKVIKQPQNEPQSLTEAAQSGDRLATLIALRDLLAVRLDNGASDRDVASLSRRLMQTIAEIEELEKTKEALERTGTDFFKQYSGWIKQQKKNKITSITNEREGD